MEISPLNHFCFDLSINIQFTDFCLRFHFLILGSFPDVQDQSDLTQNSTNDVEDGENENDKQIDSGKANLNSAKKLTKKEIRGLKKLRKQGKITEEQRALLNPELALKPTVEVSSHFFV
jgi:hypothetical protein